MLGNAEKMVEIPGFGGFEGQTWRENDRNVVRDIYHTNHSLKSSS